MYNSVDKIYVSCIFDKNRKQAEEWECHNAIIGGSGYDLDTTLPTEIDTIIPRINFGFVTRGCNRNCEFCIVHRKEGNVHKVADIDDIWDGKSANITLLDNNILFDKQIFTDTVEFAIKNNITIDFNQGLDFRLLDDDVCKLLKSMKHTYYRFAFDDIKYLSQVEKAIDLLHKHNIKHSVWYVIVGFNSNINDDLTRLEYLKQRDERPYVMRYQSVSNNKQYTMLARWVNQRHLFMKKSFQEFVKMDNNYITNNMEIEL